MTEYEGKMWNMIGSVGWVESGYDMQPMMELMQRESEETLNNLASFIETRCRFMVNYLKEYELVRNVSFGLTDQQFAHLTTEVVSRGKLTYDTYMKQPERLTGLHNNYRYTLPRIGRVT